MGALAAVDISRSEMIVSFNPATGDVLGEVHESSSDEIRAAVARARAAQQAWGALPIKERCARVARFRDLIVARAEELSTLISAETGKPPSEALVTEVMLVADFATYFVKRAPRILERERIGLHLFKLRGSYLHYQPRGVVGIISPWNFPFGIPMAEVIMSLLAGNGVVLKPSEITPLIALRAKEIYDASGMPPELFHVVPGRGSAGAALIDGGIDYCIFTGSTATGRNVGAACGERLIPCALELGGKAPAIVCADADLDRTARALVWGAFANQGQVCVSIERVYAHQAVHDELVHKIVAEVAKLRSGHDVGSMTWERQTQIVEERVHTAQAQGASVLTGGKRGGSGLTFEPTVLTDCRQDMDVMRKEIFGPVMPIMKVRDEEEGVSLANDSPFGLMAYVFTARKRKGRRLADKLEVGTAMVNDCIVTFAAPETPWAGLKQSGVGLTHSDRGLQALCQTRHVNYDRIALKRELWWFPYSERVYRTMLKMMRWIFR